MNTDTDVMDRAETIVAKIPDDIFVGHATYAALKLRIGELAHFRLEPGDHTSYRFVILPPDPAGKHGPVDRDYLVVLANSFGGAYAWNGAAVSAQYATEKWTRPWNPPVGAIVARMLTAIAAVYA